MPDPTTPPLDVTGRPLRLRDVDLDTLPAPPIGRRDRRFRQAGKAQHPDDARRSRRSPTSTARPSTRCTRCPTRCFGVRGRTGRSPRSPGPVDLVAILTGAGGRHLRGGPGRRREVRGDLRGRLLRGGQGRREARGAPARRSSESGDTRLLGPNTNLNAFSEFREDLTGPALALITQSGHQGRPIFQGQEIGIRMTHWAPTGNEVDLEFADFAALLRRPGRGGRDRRVHRGVQGRAHPDARGRPRGERCASRWSW